MTVADLLLKINALEAQYTVRPGEHCRAYKTLCHPQLRLTKYPVGTKHFLPSVTFIYMYFASSGLIFSREVF